MLQVTIVSPQNVLFSGEAHRVILPGEEGVFEVWPFHRALVSRLLPGLIAVDGEHLPIQRGVVKVEPERIIAIVEPAPPQSA